MRPPRVAFFPDSFHEVNGVAHTARNFTAYAERHQLPFLCVRAGSRPTPFARCGSLTTLELPRSAASVGMEKDLAFDPLFWRHADLIEDALHAFQPDIIHLTGPSELGIFAAYFAWKLRVPLAASWHTNVHEYAARRLLWLTRHIPGPFGDELSHSIENSALATTVRFYRRAQVLFAPNPELCELLNKSTGLPCHLMQRGVDTMLFSPCTRTRQPLPRSREDPYILGFVGRLSIEKNIAQLPIIQRALDQRGIPAKFLIIGHGAGEQSLRAALPTAEFAGVLRGEALSRAYANMDLFVFPSHTDTFGNVVLEALASGVPAIVTPHGGPRFIVRQNETGAIAEDDAFPEAIAYALNNLAPMQAAARHHALHCSWDAVFDNVYAAYANLAERAARAVVSACA